MIEIVGSPTERTTLFVVGAADGRRELLAASELRCAG
jgi:hypothetical protein